MKKILFFGITLGILTFSPALAVTPSTINTKAVVLAQVNIDDVQLGKSIRTGYYDVSFTLTTKDPEQKDVLYRVSFVEKIPKTKPNMVPKVYSYTFTRPMTITKDKPFLVEDTLPVPKDFQGLFNVTISVFNKKGLPLAFSELKNIQLISQVQAPFVIERCVVDKKIYEPKNVVTGTCFLAGTVSAVSNVALTLTYANELNPVTGITATIKNNTASFTLPLLTKAGVYTLIAQARDGNSVIGGSVITRFFVNGTATTILSIATDKQSYVTGDVAQVTAGINVFAKKIGKLYGIATIKTAGDSVICAGPVAVEVARLGSVSFNLPVTTACNGYTVHVTITNEKDSVLDKSSLAVPEEQAPQVISYLNYVLIFATIIVLLSTFIKRRTR
mgnify:CR=1 FL=1